MIFYKIHPFGYKYYIFHSVRGIKFYVCKLEQKSVLNQKASKTEPPFFDGGLHGFISVIVGASFVF